MEQFSNEFVEFLEWIFSIVRIPLIAVSAFLFLFLLIYNLLLKKLRFEWLKQHIYNPTKKLFNSVFKFLEWCFFTASIPLIIISVIVFLFLLYDDLRIQNSYVDWISYRTELTSLEVYVGLFSIIGGLALIFQIRLNLRRAEALENKVKDQRSQNEIITYEKTIELLANPNPVAQAGAVYTLHDVAVKRKNYRKQVLAILCNFIKEQTKIAWDAYDQDDYNYKAEEARMRGKRYNQPITDPNDPSNKNQYKSLSPPVQAALDILFYTKRNSEDPTDPSIYTEYQANLYKVFLYKAYLYGAQMQSVMLAEAFLTGATLAEVDFKQANLAMTNLRWANLTAVDFKQANLTSTNFIAAIFTEVDFRQANLTSTNFLGAILAESNFESTTLETTIFKGAKIGKTKFNKATLKSVDFELTNLISADFRGVTLEGVFPGSGSFQFGVPLITLFKFAYLHEADFTGAEIKAASFEKALLYNVKGLDTAIYDDGSPLAQFDKAVYYNSLLPDHAYESEDPPIPYDQWRGDNATLISAFYRQEQENDSTIIEPKKEEIIPWECWVACAKRHCLPKLPLIP